MSQRYLNEKNLLQNELQKYTDGNSEIEKNIININYKIDSYIIKYENL